ncbi:hypothetical protein JS756_08755 [Streptomyces actuosus]|uniref:DUF3558 domain-containing protein n=1 Tax=Streptomyces actuosus TaxID=1885 RepID=A0ABS2VMC2_STRAS|nr:hypothetical protein [Streptomyces actuosus]MBN0044196.1 hypothetical protein [Streptomyces actuosus]
MSSKVTHRAVAVVGAVVVVLAGVSACAGSGGFTIPERLCGVEVSPDLLRPLLPAGEEFEAERKEPASDRRQCVVSVDGKTVLSIDEFSGQRGFDAVEHARTTRPELDPQKVPAVSNAAIMDGEFVAVTSCGGGGDQSAHVLDVSLPGPRKEAGRKREALERFAVSYLPHSLGAANCTR